MSIAKVIEISASSDQGFEDAIRSGIAKASETVKGITGAWISEQKVVVDDGKVTQYRVVMKVSFVIK